MTGYSILDWGMRRKASVLVGGQFGSEAKGLAAAYLATVNKEQWFDIATTNAGAQAGHTTKFASGYQFVCFHLPTTGVIHGTPAKMDDRINGCVQTMSYINAGSIIDLASFEKELNQTGIDPRLVKVNPFAAVITQADQEAERDRSSQQAKTGSTQKGVGAALANKVQRRAQLAGAYESFFKMLGVDLLEHDLNESFTYGRGESVVVEVPQGLGLSLNHSGFYPHTTSRDCWVGSGLNDAGIHPSFLGPVCMVVRTFPIRVGHIYNETGEVIGSSGPFFAGSEELDWAKDFPGIEPERTTVTKRVRRIASWSDEQYKHSLYLNRPDIVFLSFINYLKNRATFLDRVERMHQIEEAVLGCECKHIYSWGPNVEDCALSLDEAAAHFIL